MPVFIAPLSAIVRFVNVPTVVKDDVTTLLAKVVPVSALASAGPELPVILIFHVPVAPVPVVGPNVVVPAGMVATEVALVLSVKPNPPVNANDAPSIVMPLNEHDETVADCNRPPVITAPSMVKLVSSGLLIASVGVAPAVTVIKVL